MAGRYELSSGAPSCPKHPVSLKIIPQIKINPPPEPPHIPPTPEPPPQLPPPPAPYLVPLEGPGAPKAPLWGFLSRFTRSE